MTIAEEIQANAKKEKRLYKSTFKFGSFIFPNGRRADFKGGMYVTEDAYEIEALDNEILAKHPNIFIDPNARTISAEQENPMLALKKKFYEEFQAEQTAMLRQSNDMGESNQGRLNAASTSDIAVTAAGGSGSSTAARLANLSATVGK